MDRSELFSAFLTDDFDTIIDRISQYLNNPIVIINNANRIIAATNDRAIDDKTWQNAVSRGYITMEFGTTLNNFDRLKSADRSYIEVDQINRHKRRFYKILHHNRLLGYLNVMDYYHDLNDIPDSDYEFVLSILAKELSINRNIHANMLESILFDLIDNQFMDRENFLDAIKDTYFAIPRSYNVLFADFSTLGSFNADRDTYRETISSLFPHGVFGIADKKLRVLVPSNECVIRPELLQLLNKRSIALGISDSFEDLFDYKEYERQAQAALKYRNLRFTHRAYTFYDEIRSYDLINKTKNINTYINSEISAIAQYDAKNHSDYIKTLYVYLALSQSIKAASDYLFLHRNTVNYRIKTMKELFNLRFDNPDLVGEYLFSLKIILSHQKVYEH